MDCRFLETALEEACADLGLVFQVLSQEMYLHIYINRDNNCSLNFEELTDRIRWVIVAERLKEIRWLCLYSRPFGIDTPDWEVVLELPPPTLILDPLPSQTPDRPRSLSTIASRTARQTDSTVLLHNDDIVDGSKALEVADPVQADRAFAVPGRETGEIDWSSPSSGLSSENSSLPSTLNLDETTPALPLRSGPGHGNQETLIQLPEDEAEEEDFDLDDLPIVAVPMLDRPIVEDQRAVGSGMTAESRSTQADKPKAEEPKAEEPKAEEPKAEEPKATGPRNRPKAEAIPDDRPISDYCFVRNPMLLTSEIQPPSETLTTLLDQFHQLGEPSQRQLLPHFPAWFRQLGFPQDLPWSPEQRAWIDGTDLNANDQRRAPIWFSRYCHDPVATAELMERLLRPKPEDDAPMPVTPIAERPRHAAAPIGGIAESLAEKVEPYRAKFPDWVPLVALAVASFVAIVSAFVVSSSFAGSSDALCKLSRSPKYCNLAAQMVGTEPLAKAQKAAVSLTRDQHDNIQAYCVAMASRLYGGEPTSMQQRDIVKGVVLYELKVNNERPNAAAEMSAGPVRLACLAGLNASDKIVPLRVGRIPENWPQEPYKDSEGIGSIVKFSYVQNNPIVRASTAFVFTVAGLFLAAVLNLGIRIYSLEAVVLTAICLGVLETIIFWAVPIGGTMAVMAVDVLLLFGLSFKIKGLKLELESGYHAVAMGVGAMLILRQILTWGLLASATAIN